MSDTFGERLYERIRALGPLCVGVDPSRELIESWERSDTIEGLEFVSLAVLEAVDGAAAAIKPQVAFFERFGSAGFAVLERLIRDAGDADLLVVADAKRGDIGSTNDGYAQAWLSERSPLCSDAVTASPYLGVEALAPLLAAAADGPRGVFVLAATSNDEGRAVQAARTVDDATVEIDVLRRVSMLNKRDDGRGSVGVVWGATRDAPTFDFAQLGGPVLVPGLGAQGATPSHVARLFQRCAPATVLVNVGRDILYRGPDQSSLGDSAKRWRDDLIAAIL